MLVHDGGACDEVYPVIDDVPRMLVGQARGGLVHTRQEWFTATAETKRLAVRWEAKPVADPVIAGFDYEWRRFSDVGTADQAQLFDLYFDLVPPRWFAPELTVLDAGAGAGRWAFKVSRRGPRVIAVDLGWSIEVTRSNTPRDRVACIQADLGALPLAAGTVDWAYSLGVLHHMDAPEIGLANVVRSVRPGGLVLLYLYYALDQRGPVFRGVFQAVDLARRFISRQPRAAARAIATVIAASVYWPLARSGALLERAGAPGIAAKLPLSFYRHLSFATMRNDSLDRFGTRLERRYTRSEMQDLMREAADLVDVRISDSPPFWHGVGSKPRT
ncbi:MAG: class I SAM-dependent methyltransferase [Chloroflexota bacterium]